MTITITKENFADVVLQIAEMLKEKEILEFEIKENKKALIETTYENMPDEVKKSYNDLFVNGKVKDFNRFKSVRDVL